MKMSSMAHATCFTLRFAMVEEGIIREKLITRHSSCMCLKLISDTQRKKQ